MQFLQQRGNFERHRSSTMKLNIKFFFTLSQVSSSAARSHSRAFQFRSSARDKEDILKPCTTTSRQKKKKKRSSGQFDRETSTSEFSNFICQANTHLVLHYWHRQHPLPCLPRRPPPLRPRRLPLRHRVPPHLRGRRPHAGWQAPARPERGLQGAGPLRHLQQPGHCYHLEPGNK